MDWPAGGETAYLYFKVPKALHGYGSGLGGVQGGVNQDGATYILGPTRIQNWTGRDKLCHINNNNNKPNKYTCRPDL